MKKHEEILGHDVVWFVKGSDTPDKRDMSAGTMDDIAKLICEGYTSGIIEGSLMQFQDDDAYFSIYWEIVNWRDIACQLYHAIPGKGQRNHIQESAANTFDMYW